MRKSLVCASRRGGYCDGSSIDFGFWSISLTTKQSERLLRGTLRDIEWELCECFFVNIGDRKK